MSGTMGVCWSNANDILQATMTQGPFEYLFDMYSSTSGTVAFASQSCSLQNIGAAVCSMFVSASYNGTSETTTTTATFSGTDLHYAQVPITAGGALLATAGASCVTSSATAAIATGSSSAHAYNDDAGNEDVDNSRSSIHIGLGVGIALAGVVIIAGVVFSYRWYRRRQQRKQLNANPPDYAASEKSAGNHPQPPQPIPQHQEMMHSPIVELPDEDKRFELHDMAMQKRPTQEIPLQELPGNTQVHDLKQ
jgi:hypothetical protein